jgi:hypothetical protein
MWPPTRPFVDALVAVARARRGRIFFSRLRSAPRKRRSESGDGAAASVPNHVNHGNAARPDSQIPLTVLALASPHGRREAPWSLSCYCFGPMTTARRARRQKSRPKFSNESARSGSLAATPGRIGSSLTISKKRNDRFDSVRSSLLRRASSGLDGAPAHDALCSHQRSVLMKQAEHHAPVGFREIAREHLDPPLKAST